MTETEFDKILFQALRENANENNRKLLEGYSDKNIHIFSESFNRKMYHDLKKYGISGRVIGETLEKLRRSVLKNPELNTRSELIKAVKNWLSRENRFC